MSRFIVAIVLAAVVACRFAGAQATIPQQRTLDWNYDSRMPEAMRADSDRFKYRVSVDHDRLAGPENFTKPMSIAEFEALLKANRTRSDEKLADLISGITLTERATLTRLERWKATYPGSLTRSALTAVADCSSFLQLPVADVVAGPAPPVAEQRRMVAAVGAYLGKLLPNLSNFLAIRHTAYFEDWPSFVDWAVPAVGQEKPNDPARLRNRPFYSTGTQQVPVAYRDGREVVEKKKGLSLSNPSWSRLSTEGEFGPILDSVLRDAARGKLSWKEWEQSDDGPLAVFQFEVPKEQSHFAVSMPAAKKDAQQYAAYRGEFAVRPADGAVMRLQVIAEMPADDNVQAANIQVEYGSVEIGGKRYVCPVHAVALSKMPITRLRAKAQNVTSPLQTQVSDVSFSQYQVFRSDSRIISAPSPE